MVATSTPNEALQPTGAAIPASRGVQSPGRPRRLNFGVRPPEGDRVISGRPEPRFPPGTLVRTKVGTRSGRVIRTEVIARVRILGWHGDRQRWLYYLDG